jgi:hypothetical protein
MGLYDTIKDYLGSMKTRAFWEGVGSVLVIYQTEPMQDRIKTSDLFDYKPTNKQPGFGSDLESLSRDANNVFREVERAIDKLKKNKIKKSN